MIELRHLRYFIAVAEELHFSRAAERLHIAQPPLSQQIKQLEEMLGTALLLRTKRRVELTDAGRVFLEEARRTIAQANYAVRAAQQAGRGEVGRLEVAFVASAPFNVLPKILQAYRTGYPHVALILHEMSTSLQIPALLEGRIDVGFVRLPVEGDGLQFETILKEPLVAALPRKHRLAKRKRLAVRDLAGEPFVLFPRHVAPGLYGQILGLCWNSGFTPEVLQEATEMQTIVGLVGAGLGVSLVPSSVKFIHGTGVTYVPLQDPSAVSMAVAFRKGETSAVVRSFLHVARQTSKRS